MDNDMDNGHSLEVGLFHAMDRDSMDTMDNIQVHLTYRTEEDKLDIQQMDNLSGLRLTYQSPFSIVNFEISTNGQINARPSPRSSRDVELESIGRHESSVGNISRNFNRPISPGGNGFGHSNRRHGNRRPASPDNRCISDNQRLNRRRESRRLNDYVPSYNMPEPRTAVFGRSLWFSWVEQVLGVGRVSNRVNQILEFDSRVSHVSVLAWNLLKVVEAHEILSYHFDLFAKRSTDPIRTCSDFV